MPVERLLDPSWTRVDHFDPAGPSSRSKGNDTMEVEEGCEAEGSGSGSGSGSEWEYEETEELVTLDLGPESKRLFQMSHQYSITGLESATPFFRLGNVLFKGHWDQLLGTEIVLRNEKDPSRSNSLQHDFQPLPATETDIKTGRAPSTTRKRIQFRPAANIAAREQALRDPANPSKVVLVSHKGGWIWKRGRGWIKKDQLNLLDDDEEVADDNAKAVEASEQPEVDAAPMKKTGRKKMTDEEKFKLNIWTSLKKLDKMKSQGSQGDVRSSAVGGSILEDDEGSQVNSSGDNVEGDGLEDEDDEDEGGNGDEAGEEEVEEGL
ncbi:hypothetical protein CBS101457_001459 [Exobasidium rhododendri]|nr:hypothetical protein CBS101457_001459 [Exobasidium rhododendri]